MQSYIMQGTATAATEWKKEKNTGNKTNWSDMHLMENVLWRSMGLSE